MFYENLGWSYKVEILGQLRVVRWEAPDKLTIEGVPSAAAKALLARASLGRLVSAPVEDEPAAPRPVLQPQPRAVERQAKIVVKNKPDVVKDPEAAVKLGQQIAEAIKDVAPANSVPAEPIPEEGDEWRTHKVVKVTKHGDGGRLLVLDDGSRVRMNAAGEVETTMTGEPLDPTPEEERAAIQTAEIPDGIKRATTRGEVVEFLRDHHGLRTREEIIAFCVKHRFEFAAFAKDGDNLEKRVGLTCEALKIA